MAKQVKRGDKETHLQGKRSAPGVAKPVSYAVSVKNKARTETHLCFSFAGLLHFSVVNKIDLIKQGLSKDNLDEVKAQGEFDYVTLSNLLSVSRAKLLNKKKDEKFDPATSERIMLLGDVIAYGKSVFEDDERFHTWLRKASTALGGQKPLDLMDTVYGIEEVKKELGRIEYGIF